jgi:tripartite-type tricarboxylate transporter receptor subunit TctC
MPHPELRIVGRASVARAARLMLLLFALTWPALWPASAAADAIADFYKGKDLRMIISSSVGGGYDIYARLIAKHLTRYLPGNPAIVPQNMPGAGGIAGANYISSVAPKDGTVIAAIQNTVPFEPLFENKAAQFDAVKLNWLGTPTSEVGLYLVWHGSKIKSLRDAQTQPMIAGAAGAASTPAFYGRLFNQILHLKARLVTGYPGQNEILLAMENGEVDHAVAVLVEPQDRAAGLVSGEENLVSVSIRRAAASRAQGRAVCPRPPRQRGGQDSPDRGYRRRSLSGGRSRRRRAYRPTASRHCAKP